MALSLGQIRKRVTKTGGDLRMTVEQDLLDDSELIDRISITEPYIEGEPAEVTIKRFAPQIQQRIDDYRKSQKLTADETIDSTVLAAIQAELMVGG